MGWVLRRPRLVLGIAAVTALASVVFTGWRLGMVTDQLELISDNHPLIALSDRLDPFTSSARRKFDVVVEASSPHQAISFVNELASRIEKDPEHFRGIFYRVDPEPFKSWQLLYLDKKEILAVKEKLDSHADLIGKLAADPDLLSFLQLLNQEMASRMVGELFTGFLEKGEPEKKEAPFDLGFLVATLEGMAGYLKGSPDFKSPWASLFMDASWDPDLDGYFWENNKRYLIAFVTPKKFEDEVMATQGPLERLRKYVSETQAAFPGVKAGVTGQEALNNDEMTGVMDDMEVATWISMFGVFALLVAFRRSFRRPVLQWISLCVGLCWSFGCATLLVGHLNMLSVVFAPLLCGLGDDSGIHWFSRLEEEERSGDSDMDALIRTVSERSGPGILLAGLGTTLCFLPFVLTGFKGLMELGLIAGMGTLLTLLAYFSVLPALTLLFGARGKKRGKKMVSSAAKPQAKDLIRLSPGSARLVLWGAGALTLLGIVSAGRVYFDLNPLRLQTVNAESVVWEKTLIENSHRSALYASSLAGSPEEVRKKSAAFAALPAVSEVESVYSLLPEDQEEKLPLLHSIRPSIPEVRAGTVERRPSDPADFISVLERIRFKMQNDEANRWGAERPLVAQMTRTRALASEIIEALENSPGSMERLQEYRARFLDDLLQKWDTLRKGTDAAPMKVDDLPAVLRGWYLQDGTYLLRVFPKESVWEEHALTRFVREVQSVDPQVVGDSVSLHVFASAFKNASVKASIYAVVAILVLLALTFRDVNLTLLAFLPLAMGTVWTVGIMGVADVQFNLANSIFMPLVVGAGVEYAVIILSRWKEGTMLPGHLPVSTTKGVILAALTTTVGFGALMISHHRGIFSLGFISWVGSLCVLAGSIAILPAALAVCCRPRGGPPAPGSPGSARRRCPRRGGSVALLSAPRGTQSRVLVAPRDSAAQVTCRAIL